jgi:hypothetical protein
LVNSFRTPLRTTSWSSTIRRRAAIFLLDFPNCARRFSTYATRARKTPYSEFCMLVLRHARSLDLARRPFINSETFFEFRRVLQNSG